MQCAVLPGMTCIQALSSSASSTAIHTLTTSPSSPQYLSNRSVKNTKFNCHCYFKKLRTFSSLSLTHIHVGLRIQTLSLIVSSSFISLRCFCIFLIISFPISHSQCAPFSILSFISSTLHPDAMQRTPPSPPLLRLGTCR